jgi:hypothetical protein
VKLFIGGRRRPGWLSLGLMRRIIFLAFLLELFIGNVVDEVVAQLDCSAYQASQDIFSSFS